MKIEVELHGVRDYLNNLNKKKVHFGEGYERGIVKAAEFLKEKSNEVAPLLTEALINESYIGGELKGFDSEVYVGYGPQGGISEDYALRQHEDLEFNHAPGRIAKYLEKPFRQHSMVMLRIIQKEMTREASRAV